MWILFFARPFVQMFVLAVIDWWVSKRSSKVRRHFRRTRSVTEATTRTLSRPKPEWVRREVMRLKALMPDAGCRKIATTFNRLHERRGESVGKSWVASLSKAEAAEIRELRRRLKHRVPRKMSKNVIWSLDITFVPGLNGSIAILGIIDHGSRACLALRALETKRSFEILRVLRQAIRRYGAPKVIRTDNEAALTSWLVGVSLRLQGIRHQRIEPYSPWQNGRIERFFGTFKERLRARLRSGDGELSQGEIEIFRCWYNGVRPHQHLDGLTPTEAWTDCRRSPRRWRFFEAWKER